MAKDRTWRVRAVEEFTACSDSRRFSAVDLQFRPAPAAIAKGHRLTSGDAAGRRSLPVRTVLKGAARHLRSCGRSTAKEALARDRRAGRSIADLCVRRGRWLTYPSGAATTSRPAPRCQGPLILAAQVPQLDASGNPITLELCAACDAGDTAAGALVRFLISGAGNDTSRAKEGADLILAFQKEIMAAHGARRQSRPCRGVPVAHRHAAQGRGLSRPRHGALGAFRRRGAAWCRRRCRSAGSMSPDERL
ncbi:DUF6300 family protein [Streptomyces lavendulocolor]|uniref:DUF6300 family protein n=1 Tax=Streptomyces lavendulocolor TaxID=67316 RepID=UPI003C30B580